MLTVKRLLTGFVLVSLVQLGSSTAAAQAPEAPRPAGVVFLVGGVGGLDVLWLSGQTALPCAGVRHEIRAFAWTHGFGQVFRDLQDTRHLLHKATELAEQIGQLRAAEPDRPIYLIGKSGGTAVVLRAAELLPPATLERIVLLSAAVSPAYDLRPALRATREEIVSFHSRHDQFLLNWGTRQFGTMDRVYGPSAGLSGFVVPTNLDDEGRELYERLVQISWKPRMLWHGYLGGHTGTSLPVFLAVQVAPWLTR